MSIEDTWYTITLVHHTGHPDKVDDSKPTDVLSATLLPGMTATVLLDLTADEIVALRVAALSSALDHGSDDVLRSALDKLTTAEAQPR